MCNCQVCQDTTHFRAELMQLPAEHQPVFEGLFDNLLHVEMDRDYYHAILEGSWPSAAEIIARFHNESFSAERASSAVTEHPQFEKVLNLLPQEAQPYFKGISQRMIRADVERARLRNIVFNATPDAAQLLTHFRATKPHASAH